MKAFPQGRAENPFFGGCFWKLFLQLNEKSYKLRTIIRALKENKGDLTLNKEEILEVLKEVQDPEIPVSILELDMVGEDDITIESDNKVKVTFKPTSAMCPMGSVIGVLIKKKLKDKLGVDAEVRVRPGTHMNEEMVNDIINNKEKYEQIVKRLEDAGIC